MYALTFSMEVTFHIEKAKSDDNSNTQSLNAKNMHTYILAKII